MRKTVIALAMCVTLAFSSLSTVCAASQWSAPASTTDEQKSYVEGEALAIVRGEEQLKVPGRTERIAQVSSSALQDALEDWNGSGFGAVVTNTALTKNSGRQFEENETFTIWSISDRIYGPMAISGGKIYTMTETAKYKIAQAIWCYDIEEDSWDRLPLPEEYDPHSNKDGALASLRDRLYLYGSFRAADEAGENENKGCLWRYEPYGDFWERLEIPMPNNAKGICALGDELFVVGGSVYNMQLEGAPADDEGVYDTGFYKADLARGALVRVGGKLPDDAAMDNLKITAGKDKMYIYAEIDDSFYEQDAETPENGIMYRKTVSGGRLFRVAYDGAENKITYEELTNILNETLGDDLRTDYEYKMGGDVPGEHFAIAGLDTGVAIIGSSTAGEDVHIIYDTDEKAVLYDRATCYHKAFDPIAAFSGGRLYVIGYNGTEPDVMYFRSQEITPQVAGNGSGEPEGSGSGGTGMDPTVIGGVTIGLFAVLVIALSVTRRKNRADE